MVFKIHFNYEVQVCNKDKIKVVESEKQSSIMCEYVTIYEIEDY